MTQQQILCFVFRIVCPESFSRESYDDIARVVNFEAAMLIFFTKNFSTNVIACL